MIKNTGTIEEMKEGIKQFWEHKNLAQLKSHYPSHITEGRSYGEALAAVNEYKQSVEYGVNAYFKDKGVTASKYPGKTVAEIKAIRKEKRIARALAKPVKVMNIHRLAFVKMEARFLNIDTQGKLSEGVQKEEPEQQQELLPENIVWKALPKVKSEVQTHSTLRLQAPIVDTVRKAPYEKKTMIRHHIGSIPLQNMNRQLVQSYSKDVKASAGFARISAKRYPESFRENIRALKPEVGRAYNYQTNTGTEDMCLITKHNSTDSTSNLKDVKDALADLSKKCRKTIMMPRIETGCNKHNWNDIESLIDETMKGHTVHVYSKEKPDDYGREKNKYQRIYQRKID